MGISKAHGDLIKNALATSQSVQARLFNNTLGTDRDAQIIDALEKEAEGFEKAADPTERDKLKNEKAELLARKCFVDNCAKVLTYLANIKTAHKCDQARVSTDTASITRKGKNVVSEALTPQLKGAIQTELELLGVDHLPLNLKPSGSRGEHCTSWSSKAQNQAAKSA